MLIEHRCPKCGKLFVPAPYHVYKDNGKCFCSWTCYNHRNDGRQQKKKCNAIEQYTKAGTAIRTFPNAWQAAIQIDGTANGIRIACRECKFYKGYLWRYKK